MLSPVTMNTQLTPSISASCELTSSSFEVSTFKLTRAFIPCSILSKSRTGDILFITPISKSLFNLLSTVGVLTETSLAISLRDLLPSSARAFTIPTSTSSSLTGMVSHPPISFQTTNLIPSVELGKPLSLKANIGIVIVTVHSF